MSLPTKYSKIFKSIIPQRKLLLNPLTFDDDEQQDPKPQQQPQQSFGRMRPLGKFSLETGPSAMEFSQRKPLSLAHVTELLGAPTLWNQYNVTGAGVRVAIFDTGMIENHPHFQNVLGIINWTDEQTADDNIGHGTFVAGLVASNDDDCPGFAPDAELLVFRVFTSNRVSYTSWFLDAFNYAIHRRVHVLNLSIGGPDFLDRPFVEKVWELSANGITVVSAIGNEGPLYGTLNNPADQWDVIGVGGMDYSGKVAAFSSRGMTTWELPSGYGRIKPDVIAYGQQVLGSRASSLGGCRTLSGTSVASPVVAGVVTLLASALLNGVQPISENLPAANNLASLFNQVPARSHLLNPATFKQILVEGAERLTGDSSNVFEQGMGRISLLRSFHLIQNFRPHASVLPSRLDLTECPYMWPYCTQPLFYGAMPVLVNLTVLNSVSVTGELVAEPSFHAGKNGRFLDLSFSWSPLLWPWSGHLAVSISVKPEAALWEGDAEGLIKFTVRSPVSLTSPSSSSNNNNNGDGKLNSYEDSVVEVPVKVRVVSTPPRHKRILWDQYHNLRYPSGYFPRDALELKEQPFDWNGDHPHTNFKNLYTYLRKSGYFIDVLGSPWTCFNASEYGVLLLVDPEEYYFPAEISKIKEDVLEKGLSLVVISDWYDEDLIHRCNFYDENTKQLWTAATGGATIPALNHVLSQFGVELGDRVFRGKFPYRSGSVDYASGNSIARFPSGGYLMFQNLVDQTDEIVHDRSPGSVRSLKEPILGLLDLALKSSTTTTTTPTSTETSNSTTSKATNDEYPNAGRLVVYGDSSCMDDAYSQKSNCFGLIDDLLSYASGASFPDLVATSSSKSAAQQQQDNRKISAVPKIEGLTLVEDSFVSNTCSAPVDRIDDHSEFSELRRYSKVIGRSATCASISFHRANISDFDSEEIRIDWDPKPTLFSSDEYAAAAAGGGSGGGGGHAHFREKQLVRPSKRSNFFAVLVANFGMLLPYLVGAILIGFIFVIIFLARRQRSQSKRIAV